MRVLAADVGGTTVRLALVEERGDRLEVGLERRYASREHPGLAPILHRFLAEASALPVAAALAVAGPAMGRRVRTTNLEWIVDADALAVETGIAAVVLLNDLEATAWGIGELPPAAFHGLLSGEPGQHGNAVVVAAGTGLGVAGLYWDGARHRPFASEAGHADFAPSDEAEVELFARLRTRFGHVSWERVVSGPGLVELFALERAAEAEPPWLETADDPAAAIAAAASDGEPAAVAAVERFVGLYGAAAGNLALALLATGGVYLAGGIAPKLLPWLEAPGFRERFLAKGRMRPLLERMPVEVVLDGRAALLGAARQALGGVAG